ncbi:hypothetical protein [Pasteuria penetrans]|uniref:hypothetical protein n=1 Tax=Pasteuria penetrans TaxID=86005 RepID=UPI000FC3924C|nr:hypothetical protein [Pasteuria penetrans]
MRDDDPFFRIPALWFRCSAYYIMLFLFVLLISICNMDWCVRNDVSYGPMAILSELLGILSGKYSVWGSDI